jgi:hypothetical protein
VKIAHRAVPNAWAISDAQTRKAAALKKISERTRIPQAALIRKGVDLVI